MLLLQVVFFKPKWSKLFQANVRKLYVLFVIYFNAIYLVQLVIQLLDHIWTSTFLERLIQKGYKIVRRVQTKSYEAYLQVVCCLVRV